MTFKAMTVGRLKELLNEYPDDEVICMTSRIAHGTNWTAINWVGHDKSGNLVISLNDDLIKTKSKGHTLEEVHANN